MKFNLFKKHESVYVPKRDPIQVSQPQQITQTKSIRDQALEYFNKVEALNDVKEMLYRSIRSNNRAHIMIAGPPASAKSLLAHCIEEHEGVKAYFTEGAATSKAGIQKYISENQQKEIVIVDEIDKMKKVDQEGLLTMMERGQFTSTKCRNTQTVKANIVIYATSNSTERLTKPLLSRFDVYEIPEYTYPEFEQITCSICAPLPHNVCVQIALAIWASGSKDVRDCLKIAKLADVKDTEEDIKRLIGIHLKYQKTGKEYN